VLLIAAQQYVAPLPTWFMGHSKHKPGQRSVFILPLLFIILCASYLINS